MKKRVHFVSLILMEGTTFKASRKNLMRHTQFPTNSGKVISNEAKETKKEAQDYHRGRRLNKPSILLLLGMGKTERNV